MSRASAPAAPRAKSAAPVFAALGDPTRLGLVVLLATEGPESISRLSARTAVSRQAATKHLAVLARCGLARARRHGRECIWRLDTARLADAREYLDRISRQWDDALGRLKEFVERT